METIQLRAVADTSCRVFTVTEFKDWISGPVRTYFPCGMIVCAWGTMIGDDIRVRHTVGIDHSSEYLDGLYNVTSLLQRHAIQLWLQQYKTVVLNDTDFSSQLSVKEQEECARFGMFNFAMCGSLDIAGHGGAIFKFANIPGTLTSRHARKLDMIAPYLYYTLSRIYHRNRHEFPEKEQSTSRPLTEREWQILHLVATGMSNREIAEHLSRSELTIQNHVHAILKKMGVPNRAAAVASMSNLL